MMASFRMASLLRHKTSQLRKTNIKENVRGRGINCPSFIFIALILNELQGECLRSPHHSQRTKLNLLWTEASGTTLSFL